MILALPHLLEFPKNMRAIVDVGSNSLILVIAEYSDGYWTTLEEQTRVTGIGKGTKAFGKLDIEGSAASLIALAEFKKTAMLFGIDRLESFGTMALRIASDAAVFCQHAKEQGTPVSIISGDLEAELGLESVANDPILRLGDQFSVVDPGGHSTEIVTARKVQDIGLDPRIDILQRMSLPVGALGLRENILSEPSPSVSARFLASNYLDDLLEERSVQKSNGPVVVLGATGTNLVSIREKFVSWQPNRIHGAYLDYEEISRSVSWMCELTDEGRSAIVGIEPGRERTIHIGLIILERFLYALKAEGCIVSVRGWRHAMLNRATADQNLV